MLWQGDWVLSSGLCLVILALGRLPSLGLFIWNFGYPLREKSLHTVAPQECGRLLSLLGDLGSFWKWSSSIVWLTCLSCLGSGQPITHTVHLQWRRVDRGAEVPVCGCSVHPAAQEHSLSTGKDSPVPPWERLASFWNLAQTGVME